MEFRASSAEGRDTVSLSKASCRQLDGLQVAERGLEPLHAADAADHLHRDEGEDLGQQVAGDHKDHVPVFVAGVHVVHLAPHPVLHAWHSP